MCDKRPASPVHRDERKHPMLDLVPLARARREVAHMNLSAWLSSGGSHALGANRIDSRRAIQLG